MQKRILINYNWDKPKTCAHDYLLMAQILGDTIFEPVDFNESGSLPYFWKSIVIVAKKCAIK